MFRREVTVSNNLRPHNNRRLWSLVLAADILRPPHAAQHVTCRQPKHLATGGAFPRGARFPAKPQKINQRGFSAAAAEHDVDGVMHTDDDDDVPGDVPCTAADRRAADGPPAAQRCPPPQHRRHAQSYRCRPELAGEGPCSRATGRSRTPRRSFTVD